MLSASLAESRRWVMAMVVRSWVALARAARTSLSVKAGRAEVASSRRRTRGLRATARAMAMRCFWPPLSKQPRSPTSVSYPRGRSRTMKSWAWATRAAAAQAPRSTAARPYWMF
mmetsp:Transcript_7158/g.22049  ORF Transcript_7158/g.22049 Transcript_7158/m.22049 type:complete len:114 (-) Transcript_7158:11-352(-)